MAIAMAMEIRSSQESRDAVQKGPNGPQSESAVFTFKRAACLTNNLIRDLHLEIAFLLVPQVTGFGIVLSNISQHSA